jgi:hypothetical protein
MGPFTGDPIAEKLKGTFVGFAGLISRDPLKIRIVIRKNDESTSLLSSSIVQE